MAAENFNTQPSARGYLRNEDPAASVGPQKKGKQNIKTSTPSVEELSSHPRARIKFQQQEEGEGKLVLSGGAGSGTAKQGGSWGSDCHRRRGRSDGLEEREEEEEGGEGEATWAGIDSMTSLEDKFSSLALKFRRSMSLYGLLEDVSLLLDARATVGCSRTCSGERPPGASKWWQRSRVALCRAASLGLVLVANLTAVYVLLAHLVWEYRMLDAKQAAAAESGDDNNGAARKSPSMLKEFLENLRRHLARFFSLGLTLTWHLSCHRIERLFVDCQRYYSMFYNSFNQQLAFNSPPSPAARDAELALEQQQQQRQRARPNAELLEASSRFYRLAAHRINLALWLPVLHYLFNILSVSIFPSSQHANRAHRALANLSLGNSTSSRLELAGDDSMGPSEGSLLWGLLTRALENFDSFHMAIHTAFHPLDHKIARHRPPASGAPAQQQQQPLASAVTRRQSALYCLVELFVYSMYFNGPRIICATCLSLVLHIHYQCLRAFNRQLMGYIKRPRGQPMQGADVVSLVKQYDLIVMMHARIERTFKWSIVLWYSLMFVSCLMHIFSFTESTSAYVVSTTTTSSSNPLTAAANWSSPAQQPQQQVLIATSPLVATNSTGPPGAAPSSPSTSSIAIMFIRLASVFFVCYSPCLIYSEAFKIESASVRAEQLVMRLARRQADPLAQAIEPTLFEPIYLSVGGYFDLTKRSMSAFLGAVVTFSVMFIGAKNRTNGYLAERTKEHLAALLLEASVSDDVLDRDEADDDWNEADDDDDDDERLQEEEEAGDEELNGLDLGEELERPAGDEAPSFPFSRRLGLAPPAGSSSPVLSSSSAQSAPQAPAGNGRQQQQQQQKARQRRKFKRLRMKQQNATLLGARSPTTGQPGRQLEAPRIEAHFEGRVREHERLVELRPKLRVLNQAAEVCDFELRLVASGPATSGPAKHRKQVAGPSRGDSAQQEQVPFVISWVDRVSGEATLEATSEDLMDCERRRNYTLWIKAIGCNGLESNEASVAITMEDVNEFSPEFERHSYSVTHEQEEEEAAEDAMDPPPTQVEDQDKGLEPAAASPGPDGGRLLLSVEARDRDCSPEFGSVCRYELLAADQQQEALDGLSIDGAGRIWMARTRPKQQQHQQPARRPEKYRVRRRRPPGGELGSSQVQADSSGGPHWASRSFQVIAYDCGGKKSQTPASVQVNFSRLCRPALKDVDTQLAYLPGSGARSPFLRAQLDLCAAKCHRPNISLALRLEATPQPGAHRPVGASDLYPEHGSSAFHCDRDTYSMVSKRRLCGASRRALELLPPYSAHTSWIRPLARQESASGRLAQAQEEEIDAKQEERGLGGAELEKEEEEEEKLGAYSAEGSYSRRALQFQLNQGGLEPGPAASGEATLRARSAGRRGSRRKQQKRRLAARSTTTTNYAPSAGGQQRPDPSNVYRDQVYQFDGRSSAVLVPHALLTASHEASTVTNEGTGHLFGPKHTLSFWMRHSPGGGGGVQEPERHSASKEHLLCATVQDPPGHYYALFIRNCRLALLMRRKPNPRPGQSSPSNESQVYLPAEWRWTLPANEACDNKWHLYTVNVNFPTVELYVDGGQFEESYHNLVVVDDLPLQQAASRHLSRASSVTYEDEPPQHQPDPPAAEPLEGVSVSLGACWDAQHRSWSGHFRGSLSGLTVSAGANDDSRSIECLGACSEELVSTAWPTLHDQAGREEDEQQQRQQTAKMDNSLVSYQESQSRVLLQGHDLLDVEEALGQIAYVNHRQLPSIGRRSIIVDTSVECSLLANGANSQEGHHQTIAIEPLRVEVNVLPSQSLPVLSIGGTPNLAREYEPFLRGVPLFGTVSLRSKRLNLQQFMRHSSQVEPSWPANRSSGASHHRAGNKQSFRSGVDTDYIDDDDSTAETLAAASVEQQQQQQPRRAPENLAANRRRVESCSVQVYPPLNGLHESLLLPLDQIDALQLYWRQSHEGFVIYGLDSADNYERLIRAVLYRNQKPALYLERVFKLLCTDLNGRLLSNEYLQTVTIIHDTTGGNSSMAGDDGSISMDSMVGGSRVQHDDGPAGDGRTGGRPALLRQSRLEMSAAAGEPVIFSSFAGQQQLAAHHRQPMAPLNLEQSSQLDRIAMAFLVFVVSLIVIMLVIALTNLKEPGLKTTPGDVSGHRKRSKRDRKNFVYADEDEFEAESRPNDCLYVDELDSDEEDEEDNDEEEDENECLYDRDCYSSSRDAKSNQRCQTHQRKPAGPPHSSRARNPFSSSTTDQESLAWDEEEGLLELADENDDDQQTTIVMNPIVHGDQSADDQLRPMLVAEQRPNWRGAITRAPRTRLTYPNSPSSISDDFDLEPVDFENFSTPTRTSGRREDESTLGQDKTSGRQVYQDVGDEELASCCSSASSSGSSTSGDSDSSASGSSSGSEEEFVGDDRPELPPSYHQVAAMEAHGRLCRRHSHHNHHRRHHKRPNYLNQHHAHRDRQIFSGPPAEEPEAGAHCLTHHYELYHGHNHHHHFHHRCLKQPTTVGASHHELGPLELASSSNNSSSRESISENRKRPPANFRPTTGESQQVVQEEGEEEDWPSELTAALTCATSSTTNSCASLAPTGSAASTLTRRSGSMKSDTQQRNGNDHDESRIQSS